MTQDKQRLCVREHTRARGAIDAALIVITCTDCATMPMCYCGAVHTYSCMNAFICVQTKFHYTKDGFTTKSILEVWDKDNEHCVCG